MIVFEADLEYLEEIIRFCKDMEDIVRVHGSDEEYFYEDKPMQYSCVFSIIQIGKHVKGLSSELRTDNSEVDWRGIAGTMDVLVHNYGKIWVALT